MNTRLSLQSFERARGRCRRMSDNVVFAGWVTKATVEYVEMRMRLQTAIRAEDEFTIELYGENVRAIFLATAKAARAGEQSREVYIQMAPNGGIRYVVIDEEARMQVKGVSVRVVTPDGIILGEAHDLSKHGIGTILPVELPSGSEFTLEVAPARSAPFILNAQVRYARQDEAGYRTGFRIQSLARLEQARWNQILEDEGEILAA